MATTPPQDALHAPAGAIIFQQGDPGREMFLIASGHVRLTVGSQGHERALSVLGPGDFFGELALLSDETRSATATAADDCTLLVIGRDVFSMMVQDDLDIVARMMSILGRRLSRANEPIQTLSRQIDHIRIAAHCLWRVAGAPPQLPTSIDIEALGAELSLAAQVVEAVVTDLVQCGIGVLQNQHWSIQDDAQVVELIRALRRYADGAAA